MIQSDKLRAGMVSFVLIVMLLWSSRLFDMHNHATLITAPKQASISGNYAPMTILLPYHTLIGIWTCIHSWSLLLRMALIWRIRWWTLLCFKTRRLHRWRRTMLYWKRRREETQRTASSHIPTNVPLSESTSVHDTLKCVTGPSFFLSFSLLYATIHNCELCYTRAPGYTVCTRFRTHTCLVLYWLILPPQRIFAMCNNRENEENANISPLLARRIASYNASRIDEMIAKGHHHECFEELLDVDREEKIGPALQVIIETRNYRDS